MSQQSRPQGGRFGKAQNGCELCGRSDVALTAHHLIPQTRQSNKRVKRDTRPEQRHRKAKLCDACHRQIHLLFTEKELERTYDSVAKLKTHPDVQRWVQWITKRWGVPA